MYDLHDQCLFPNFWTGAWDLVILPQHMATWIWVSFNSRWTILWFFSSFFLWLSNAFEIKPFVYNPDTNMMHSNPKTFLDINWAKWWAISDPIPFELLYSRGPSVVNGRKTQSRARCCRCLCVGPLVMAQTCFATILSHRPWASLDLTGHWRCTLLRPLLIAHPQKET